MKKLFKITFDDEHTLYVAAQDWKRIGEVYEHKIVKVELVSEKVEVLKDREHE